MSKIKNGTDVMIRWEFARKLPNAVQSEPIAGEFFAGLSAPADKLVRESIQNSLDAKVGTGPVRVRFTIPAEPVSVTPNSPWLAGLMPHLVAERNGLSSRHRPSTSLSVLLIEDFGTCGLTGDPAQTDDVAEGWSGQKNNFFYFWRAIGTTGKGEGDKGSWGLGKSVIPASSRIHTFFGVSWEKPGGDGRLLGLSVLKTHTISGCKQTFTPYGYFGLYASQDSVAMPVHDKNEVAAFCRDFGVTRQGEPGLSLVVLDPQLAFSGPPLIASAVINYFFPILDGQLIVEVVAGDKITVIDAESLCDCERLIPPQMFEEHRVDQATLHDMLALARWSIEQRRAQAVRLNAPPDSMPPRWYDSIFAVDGWESAVLRFAAGEAVEFVVPVSVTPKASSSEMAEFFVSMKKVTGDQKAKSFYLRDGITVGGIPEPVARGLVAITSVESGALAKFLRRSENPSHSKWIEDGVVEHYKNPRLLLSFVKGGIAAIHSRLTRVNEGIDADLLADLFFLEENADDAETKPTGGGRGTRPQKVRVPILNAQTQ